MLLILIGGLVIVQGQPALRIRLVLRNPYLVCPGPSQTHTTDEEVYVASIENVSTSLTE